MKKTFKILAGFVLVLIGLVGLLLPIMPGWAFIIPGLIILGEYFHPIRRLVDWAKSKLESADVPGWRSGPGASAPPQSAKMEDRP